MGNKISAGIGWKLMERFGVYGMQFVLQVILARLLNPEYYGILSLMMVFTVLANVFVQNGFNTALIQNKNVTEDDYSSVFWVSTLIAIVLYAVLFFCAPIIAVFYKMPEIVTPFRVLSLILLPGALNSVQLAKVTKEMDFRTIFTSNIVSIVLSGVIGIILAYFGAGLWALVAQSLLNIIFSCVVMWFTVKWKPVFVCEWKRIKELFSFGWKLLVSSLLDILSQDLSTMVIGLKYSADTLGMYNRGKQFPQFFANSANGAIQSVLLPAMSLEQDDKSQVKSIVKNSISLSCYILFPVMAGLASVAEPLVKLLLTDKWLPCVPYLQIFCITFAFFPVYISNLQAINALGRSEIFLKLEIIKKIIAISVLVIAVLKFNSPMAIALSDVLMIPISIYLNSFPNKKLISYGFWEQIKDLSSSLMLSVLMFACVWLITLLNLGTVITLIIQVVVGVVSYLLFSLIVRPKPFVMLLKNLKINI